MVQILLNTIIAECVIIKCVIRETKFYQQHYSIRYLARLDSETKEYYILIVNI